MEPLLSDHLGRDDHFCRSGRGDGLAVDRHWVCVGGIEASQLLSFLIYRTASSQVDEEREENHHPICRR